MDLQYWILRGRVEHLCKSDSRHVSGFIVSSEIILVFNYHIDIERYSLKDLVATSVKFPVWTPTNGVMTECKSGCPHNCDLVVMTSVQLSDLIQLSMLLSKVQRVMIPGCFIPDR